MKKDRRSIFRGRTLSNLIVVCAGVVLYLVLSNFGAVGGALARLLAIIQPFIVGIAIAFLLNIPMRFFEQRVFYRLRRRRGLSIVVTYLLAVALVALLLGSIVPQLIESIRILLGNITVYLENLNRLVTWVGETLGLSPESIDSFMISYNDIFNDIALWLRAALPDLLNALPNLLNVTMQIGSGIVGALTALIASIYMLASKEKLLRQCRRLLYAVLKPRPADEVMRIGGLSNRVFSGFIGGKIIDSAIIGVICFIFMSLMNLGPVKMPYALLISVIIGVTNLIPFFGPFIGAIPSILILLMVNFWSALWFTIFIIVLQQFDGNILGPKILGDTTGLPALWVLIAIIVGGGLFGFIGMLLGVPTGAVLYSLASDLIEKRLKKRGLDAQTNLVPAPPGETPAPQGPPLFRLWRQRKKNRGEGDSEEDDPPENGG